MGTIDPLFATSRAEWIAARQIYEPLISRERGPFDQTRELSGPARRVESLEGGSLWIARLRPGVTFTDGEPLDGGAVKANADRWIAGAVGREVVPELAAVDYPRPGLVRFILNRPTPDFDRILSRPELGLVSPAAIAAAGTGPIRWEGAGTGPFELRERDGDRVLLARNAAWWGTPLGLGPGVDQIELLSVPDVSLRAEQLESGQVEVADALDRPAAEAVAANPLLATVSGGGDVVGIERSVRGLDAADPGQSLADVWLTDLR